MGTENRRGSFRWRKLVSALAVTCILVAVGCASASDDRSKQANENIKIFDGKLKVIVINGYSTSFQ